MLAAEVTERLVDRARVVATFNTEIIQTGIQDYLFFGDPDAEAQANQFFAQGHEINFVDLPNWIHVAIATIGRDGQQSFFNALRGLHRKAGYACSHH